ncbi:regulator of nonsense transcripts 2-like [Zerene cesonia]|uniref:regulator of nonsense transcripts 2-like n=1 Tax=Zerene cesonia TaxID=33412 RepID=UPI0018E55602|nr:regulator of nonsense transcripts 2-like [Zerene cesonia]
MAYYRNFYNIYHGSNSTFQNEYPNALPTPPPPPITPFSLTPNLSDQEFIKKFERHIKSSSHIKPKNTNMGQLKEKLSTLMLQLKEIQDKHKKLSANVDYYSEDEWKSIMNAISNKKCVINELISQFNSPYMELARKYLAKRTAKRLRLKRLQEERKRDKMDRKREKEERSRKIDEDLQKIKDDILKAKQEEEAQLEADMVLKDVIRKKSDGKKCLAKMDALIKLRQARQNTARGRGQNISDNETDAFQKNIEKLKTIWTQRLELYDKEETSLRSQLTKANSEPVEETIQIETVLGTWRQVLFGGGNPQVDFNGDIDKFVSVRSHWDQYIDSEGTPLPIGWVVNI